MTDAELPVLLRAGIADTCGSPVVVDLSGGFCTGCHAEGLDQDEIAPQKPEGEAGG